MPTFNIKPFSYLQLVFLLAAYFALPLNLPVYAQLAHIFNQSTSLDWGFALSIPLFFLFALNFIFQIFSWPYLFKPFFAVLLVLSALISFAGFQYGVIVNQDMLVNVLETDRGEAGSYLTIYSVLWLLGFGLVPALALLLPQSAQKKVPCVF